MCDFICVSIYVCFYLSLFLSVALFFRVLMHLYVIHQSIFCTGCYKMVCFSNFLIKGTFKVIYAKQMYNKFLLAA